MEPSKAGPAVQSSRGGPTAQSSGNFHESEDKIGPEVADRYRAIVSLMEELEAMDWYNQRSAVAHDDGLREILAHNRDEEKKHRRDPELDLQLRQKLFTEGSIAGLAEVQEGEGGGAAGGVGRPKSTTRRAISLGRRDRFACSSSSCRARSGRCRGEPGVGAVARPGAGGRTHGARPRVLPLVELRAGFEVPMRELEAIDRGSLDPNLDALHQAAIRLAYAENQAVFHGYAGGGIHGMSEFLQERALVIRTTTNTSPAPLRRPWRRSRRPAWPGGTSSLWGRGASPEL